MKELLLQNDYAILLLKLLALIGSFALMGVIVTLSLDFIAKRRLGG